MNKMDASLFLLTFMNNGVLNRFVPFAVTTDGKSGLEDKTAGMHPVCYCHGRRVETGFVCTGCQAIYCVKGPSALCANCNSRFNVSDSGAENISHDG